MPDSSQEQRVRERLARRGLKLVGVDSGPNAPYMVVAGELIVSSGLDLDAVEIERDELDSQPDDE